MPANASTTGPRSLSQRLDEAPLKLKLSVLMPLAVLAGALVGLVEARLGHAAWPLVGGVSVLSAAGVALGRRWLLRPLDGLCAQLERLADPDTLLQRDLPVSRPDETGRIARQIHRMVAVARRQGHEANRLRRTLDHRVQAATRRATSELRHMALRDPLTGLGNRRCLDEQLPALLDATREAGQSLLCIVMDLDDFKQVNDRLGHAAGDQALALLGQLIRGSIRPTDVAVRLGGDEFVLLVPGADVQRGARLIDQIRRLFRQQSQLARPDGPHADISAGLALMPADGAGDAAWLLREADRHLYRAKQTGRGRTCDDRDDRQAA